MQGIRVQGKKEMKGVTDRLLAVDFDEDDFSLTSPDSQSAIRTTVCAFSRRSVATVEPPNDRCYPDAGMTGVRQQLGWKTLYSKSMDG